MTKNQPKPDKLGAWIIQNRLGKGGNGIVWAATHEDGRQGALKVLHLKYQRTESPRFKRFRDEAHTQASLCKSPGVLPVLEQHFPENPGPNNPAWLVTPLATTIEKALGKSTTLPSVVSAVASIAETLAELHGKGISHRDIKPSNLYQHNGAWALGDFGLVSFPGKAGVTASGEQLGPAYYVAPEMVSDAKHADGRKADVYSLAKTLWVLSTKQRYPPPGTQLVHAGQTIRSSLDDPTAGALDLLIAQATLANPEERPAMAEIASELRLWLTVPKPTPASATARQYAHQVAIAIAPAQAIMDKEESRVALAEATLSAAWLQLQPIAELFVETHASAGVIREDTEFRQGNGGIRIRRHRSVGSPWPIWQRSLYVSAAWPAAVSPSPLLPGRLTLYGIVQIMLFADESLIIDAAHLIRTRYGPRILWSTTSTSRVGSAQQQVYLAEATNGLLANLGFAFKLFVQYAQWDGVGSPPGTEEVHP